MKRRSQKAWAAEFLSSRSAWIVPGTVAGTKAQSRSLLEEHGALVRMINAEADLRVRFVKVAIQWEALR